LLLELNEAKKHKSKKMPKWKSIIHVSSSMLEEETASSAY